MRKRGVRKRKKTIVTPKDSEILSTTQINLGSKVMEFCFEGNGGHLDCKYEPTIGMLYLAQVFGDALYPTPELVASYANTLGVSLEEAEKVTKEEYQKALQKTIEYAGNLLCAQVKTKLSEALRELVWEITAQTIRDLNGKEFDYPGAERTYKFAFELSEKLKKERMGITSRGGARNVKHKWSDEDHNTLAFQYERLKPIWKDAKTIFLQNRKREEWAKMVSIAHDDLPDELISKLADEDPYAASPSSIALEHAAVLCGFNVGTYSVRQLKRKLLQAKRQVSQGHSNPQIECPKHGTNTVTVKVQV